MTDPAPAPAPLPLADLASHARELLNALAQRPDPAAFQALLGLSRHVGECLGASARTLAAHRSWSAVAEAAGTSRQAAWERWHVERPERGAGAADGAGRRWP